MGITSVQQIYKATALHFLLAAVASFAFALDVAAWIPMEWKEFRPLPAIEESNGEFHIGKVISKSGLALKAPSRIKAKSGDDFYLFAQARGQGEATVKLQYFDGKGRRCGLSKHSAHIELEQKWSNVNCILPVENTTRGAVEYVLPILELNTGSEISMRKCRISLENNSIASNLPFPNEWNVFIFDQYLDELDFPLDMIPEQIHCVHWKIMTLENGFIRFNTEFSRPRMRNNAVLYAYIYSPTETDYIIGAGADFYMNMYVNGKSVLNTMKEGNRFPDNQIHYSNYKVKTSLHKGQNLIVIHFQSGVGKYPRLALCGPDTLKNMEKQLVVENYLMKGDPNFKEDFTPPSQVGENKEYSDGESILAKYRPFIYAGKQAETALGLGLKIYSLSNEGHILYGIGNDLSLKVRSNKDTGGLVVSVHYKGNELKNIRLPQDILPCCLTFASNKSDFYVNALSIGSEKLAYASGVLPEPVEKKVDMRIDFVECYAIAGDFYTAIMHQGISKDKRD